MSPGRQPPRGPDPGPPPPGEDDHGVVDLYVEGLRRSQLQLAGLALVALVGLVGALPLLSLVLPALRGTVGQVPLAALLPLLPFPAFVLVGVLQRRRADGLERAFRALVDPPDADDDPAGP